MSIRTIGEFCNAAIPDDVFFTNDTVHDTRPLTDLANLDGVHVIPNVWSDGRTVRRYVGQGDGFKRSPAKGYRKMVAILVEIPEEIEEEVPADER